MTFGARMQKKFSNFTTIAFFSIATMYSTAFSQGIAFVDFESNALGPYTNDAALKDFPSKQGISKWYAMEQNGGQNATIIEHGEHGKVLRLRYPEGCLGPNDDPLACAGQIKNPLPIDEPADTMWIGYDIFFEDGFEFMKGGKLPGLCGGKCYTGGNRPSIGDGWSARIMWRVDGAADQYLYFVDQAGKYGDDALFNLGETIPQKKFTHETWHRVVTKITMNTVRTEGTGEKDGTIKTWFDGELVLDLDTLRWREFNDTHIDIFYLSTFHGGNDETWSPTADSYAQFDNFEISLDSVSVTHCKKSVSDSEMNAVKNRGIAAKQQSLRSSKNSTNFYKADGSKIDSKLKKTRRNNIQQFSAPANP